LSASLANAILLGCARLWPWTFQFDRRQRFVLFFFFVPLSFFVSRRRNRLLSRKRSFRYGCTTHGTGRTLMRSFALFHLGQPTRYQRFVRVVPTSASSRICISTFTSSAATATITVS